MLDDKSLVKEILEQDLDDNNLEAANDWFEIGHTHYKLGYYEKSQEYILKSITIFESFDDFLGMARCNNILGAVYKKWGLYDNALKKHFEALELLKSVDSPSEIARSYNNVGNVFRKLKKYDLALTNLYKSLSIKEEIGDYEGMSYSYNNLGHVYQRLGRLVEAEDYINKALNINFGDDNKRGKSYSLSYLGELKIEMGETERALELLDQAIVLKEEIGDFYGIARVLHFIGIAYFKSRDYAKAEKYFFESITKSKQEKINELIYKSYESLYELYEEQADYKKALKYFKIFKKVQAKMFNEDINKKITEVQVSSETAEIKKQSEMYRRQNVEIKQQNNELVEANKQREKIETELLEYRKKCHEQTNFFQEILHNSRNVIYRYDEKQKKYDYISEYASQVIGLPIATQKSMVENTRIFIHPDDLTAINKKWAVARQKRDTLVSLEYDYRKKNQQGVYVWLREYTLISVDKNGDFNYRLGIVYCIDEEKKQAFRLAENRRMFRELICSLPFSCLVYENEQAWFANQLFYQQRGLATDINIAAQKEILTELIHPDDRSGYIMAVRDSAASAHSTRTISTRIINQATTRYQRYITQVICLRGDYNNIQIVIDTPDSVASQQTSMQIMANIAHEIKTPLHGIIGFSDVLMHNDLSSENTQHVVQITNAAKTLSQLVDSALEMSMFDFESQNITLATLNPEDIKKELIHLWTKICLEKKLDFSVDFKIDYSQVRGDYLHLLQVLNNLIDNAIKYTEAGSISIQMHQKKLANSSVCVNIFSVEDTGIGIAEDSLDDIFQRFVQESTTFCRNYSGAGLGLTICKNIVDLMGGEMQVKSKKGKGSTFIVSIPLQIIAET